MSFVQVGQKTIQPPNIGQLRAQVRLAEAGQPDWVIQAQLGHVSPMMIKTYSRVRRKALDAAAAALEPAAVVPSGEQATTPTEPVTSQSTSQSGSGGDEGRDLVMA
jgi:hypothetical protein